MKCVIIESPYAGDWYCSVCRRPYESSLVSGRRPVASECHPSAELASVVDDNVDYLDQAFRHALARGEAPIASHGSRLVHVLDDRQPDERKRAIAAGTAWFSKCDLVAFYVDRGMSHGMIAALELALELGVPFEFRRLETRPVTVEVVVTVDDETAAAFRRLSKGIASDFAKLGAKATAKSLVDYKPPRSDERVAGAPSAD